MRQHRAALAAWGFLLAASARAQDTEVITAAYEGSLGDHRIGMTLVVKEGRVVPDSHYFYRKYLTDIPLTGTAGTAVALEEPQGGAFALRF